MAQSTTEASFSAKAVLAWWEALQPRRDLGRRGDAATLAQLRRCQRPIEVHFVPAFERLVRSLPRARVEDLAVTAAVCAHVREHAGTLDVATQIARAAPGKATPPVSPERFRRLLQTRGPMERLTTGARLVRLLGGSTNVVDLASSIYAWDDQEDVRIRWARNYYGNLPIGNSKDD